MTFASAGFGAPCTYETSEGTLVSSASTYVPFSSTDRDTSHCRYRHSIALLLSTRHVQSQAGPWLGNACAPAVFQGPASPGGISAGFPPAPPKWLNRQSGAPPSI